MTPRQVDLRLDSGSWLPLLPRVFAIAGAPIPWDTWVMAGCLRAAPGAAAAASTAARLWGLIDQKPSAIEIATTRNIRDVNPKPERPEFSFHRVGRLPPDQIVSVGVIPITTVERTLLDVCGTTPPWVFNEAVDAALRRNLVSLDKLTEFLERERRSGVNGVQRLREAVTIRSQETGTTRSSLERRFLSLLHTAGVPPPELNQEIRGPEGFCATVDMVYPEAKLIVEIQSYAHHSSLRAFNSDAERLGTLTSMGYRVLEVTSEQIYKRPQRTTERVASLLRSIPRSSNHAGRG
jgi:hypothetical protein